MAQHWRQRQQWQWQWARRRLCAPPAPASSCWHWRQCCCSCLCGEWCPPPLSLCALPPAPHSPHWLLLWHPAAPGPGHGSAPRPPGRPSPAPTGHGAPLFPAALLCRHVEHWGVCRGSAAGAVGQRRAPRGGAHCSRVGGGRGGVGHAHAHSICHAAHAQWVWGHYWARGRQQQQWRGCRRRCRRSSRRSSSSIRGPPSALLAAEPARGQLLG